MKKIFILILLSILNVLNLYGQDNKLNFTVQEVNNLLNRAMTSIQPSDTTVLMLKVRQEALSKINYTDTTFLYNRIKIFINDSLNQNSRNWQTAQQVKLLVNDSLNANARGWQTGSEVANRIKDSLNINAYGWQNAQQVKSFINDSLNANTRQWQSLQNLLRVLSDSMQVLRNLIQGQAPTYPLPVSNFNGIAGDSKITLSWTYPTDSDSIVIERRSSITGGLFIKVTKLTSPTSTYVDTPLTNNVEYEYRIRNFFNNQGSSIVSISGLIPEPPRQEFFFTIEPTSINFNNLPSGQEPNALDAESGTLAGFDTVITTGGTVSATQTSKIHGNLGYRFIFDGNPTSQVQLRKNLININSDTISFRFYIKFPANRPFKDTVNSQSWSVLYLKRTTGANGGVGITSNNNSNYLKRATIFTGSTVFFLNFPSNTYNFITDSPVCIEYVLYRHPTNGGVKLYWNGKKIADTMGINTALYSMASAEFGKLAGGTVRAGEEFTLDDIIISDHTIGLYSGKPETATITVSNDSSQSMSYTISIPSPFNINGNNLIDTIIASGERHTYTILIDTTNLSPGSYNRQMYITNLFSTQSISLTYTKGSTSGGNEGSNAWFVDNRATGSNNGTSWTNAWTSLSQINWNYMSDGDTLYISGGSDSLVYNEAIGVVGRSNITITKGKSEGYNGRVIIKAPTAGSGTAVQILDKSNVKISKLEFHNWKSNVYLNGIINKFYLDSNKIINSYGGFVTTGGGVDTTTPKRNIWITNNYITTADWSTDQYEFSLYGTKNVYMIGNIVINSNNNPTPHDDFVQGDGGTNNYFINNYWQFTPNVQKEGNANGLSAITNHGGDWVSVNNIFVKNNYQIVANINLGYKPNLSPTVYFRNWAKVLVANNTSIMYTGRNFVIDYDSQAVVKNNILWMPGNLFHGGSGGLLYFMQSDLADEPDHSVDDYIIRNNIMINNSSYTRQYLGGANVPPMHSSNQLIQNTTTTPGFVNFFYGNTDPQQFQLTSSSICKDAGESNITFTMHPDNDPAALNYLGSGLNLVDYYLRRDFEGRLRDSNWDVGAYEYVP